MWDKLQRPGPVLAEEACLAITGFLCFSIIIYHIIEFPLEAADNTGSKLHSVDAPNLRKLAGCSQLHHSCDAGTGRLHQPTARRWSQLGQLHHKISHRSSGVSASSAFPETTDKKCLIRKRGVPPTLSPFLATSTNSSKFKCRRTAPTTWVSNMETRLARGRIVLVNVVV